MIQEPLKYLSELVKIQANGEAAVQSLMAKTMKQSGCEVEFYDYLPTEVPVKGEFSIEKADSVQRRSVLIATAKGDPNLPSLLIFAHPDCEPVKNFEKWSSHPFSAVSNSCAPRISNPQASKTSLARAVYASWVMPPGLAKGMKRIFLAEAKKSLHSASR